MALERATQHHPRALARALTAPGAVLAGGAAASAGIVADLPLVVAAVAGAAVWAGGVVVALPRRRGRRASRIDPFTVGEPWRHDVTRALQARNRYRRAVADVPEGPLRERLAAIGERVDEGVEACWRTARRGHELDRARTGPSAEELRARVADLDRRAGGDPALAPAAEAARRQLASVERVEGAAADARSRLALLSQRLDEAATRAVELALRVGEPSDLGGPGHDVEVVVDELEALRRALDEVAGPGGDPRA